VQVQERIRELEERTERLAARLERVEARVAPERPPAWAPPVAPAPERPPAWAPPVAPAPPPPRRAPAPPAPAPSSARRDASPAPTAPSSARPGAGSRPGLEDLLAGRVLAWAGGLAVLAGVVLLVAFAVSRGWLGEAARCALGGAVSLTLLTAGAWLYERRGRTDAALAAAAGGVAGLFAAAVVAARVYEILPLGAALAVALATGAAGAALAVRWRTPGVAALGILGALAAPAVVGAPSGDAGTLAFLLVAGLAAAAVLVRERWDAIAVPAVLLLVAQWSAGLLVSTPAALEAVGWLVGFGLLGAAAAVGLELRERADVVRPAAVLLLAVNALALGAVGAYVLGDGAGAWLAAVAAAHLGLGLALLRSERASHAVGVVACALGTLVADVALAELLSGAPLAIAWAATAVGFAALLRRATPPHSLDERAAGAGLGGHGAAAHGLDERAAGAGLGARHVAAAHALDERAAGAGLGGHVALVVAHALTVGASPALVQDGGAVDGAGAAGLVALAAAAFASALLLPGRPAVRTALHALGLATVAYLTALTLDGEALAAAWAAEGAVLAALTRRLTDLDRVTALLAAPLYAGGALFVAVTWVAPLTEGGGAASDPLAALVALGAVAAAALAGGVLLTEPAADDDDADVAVVRGTLLGVAVLAVMQLTSVLLAPAPLAAAWALEAALLVEVARRTREPVAAGGGVLLAGSALLMAVLGATTPDGLLDGVADPAGALLALGAAAAAALHLGRRAAREHRTLAVAATATGALAALHLASLLVVTAAGGGQDGQVLLSALWGVVGVVALVAGLRRDLRLVRAGALALLLLALGKVFTYDLAALDALARVASFLALGVLLLLGAFLWQRLRPRPLPDLREVPEGLR